MQFLDQTRLLNRFPLPLATVDQKLIEGLVFRLIRCRNHTGILAQVSEGGLTLISVNQNQAAVTVHDRHHRFKLTMSGDGVRQPPYPALVSYPDMCVA